MSNIFDTLDKIAIQDEDDMSLYEIRFLADRIKNNDDVYEVVYDAFRLGYARQLKSEN